MKIHIPNSAFIGNIDPFLRRIDLEDPDTLEITTNDKWISVHPVAISLVAALGLNIEPERIKHDTLSAKSAHYLERMSLFNFLNIDSGMRIEQHEPAGRFIPIQQIKSSNELSNFLKEMIPLLHLEPKQVEPIIYIVSELVRNVIEHAGSDNGAIVCAQYYKKSNRIGIGIVDTGVGIKNSINRSHSAINDERAIQLALTPGITGTTTREGGTETNAGAGLFFIKTIAVASSDNFMLYSGNTLYKSLKRSSEILHIDPFKDRHSKTSNLPSWSGTVVGIDISLNQAIIFSVLLDNMKKLFSKAVKERKKGRHKSPKFI